MVEISSILVDGKAMIYPGQEVFDGAGKN